MGTIAILDMIIIAITPLSVGRELLHITEKFRIGVHASTTPVPATLQHTEIATIVQNA